MQGCAITPSPGDEHPALRCDTPSEVTGVEWVEKIGSPPTTGIATPQFSFSEEP